MSKEEIIARVLTLHRIRFLIQYDTGQQLWECSHHECHAIGTIEHIIEHQADEIVKALP